MSIAFVGMTHLGLVSAVGAAIKGYQVLCYDPNPELICQLQYGMLPISEPMLQESIKNYQNRLSFTSDIRALSHVPLVYIAPDVPTNELGISNLEPIHQYIQQTLAILAPTTVVVIHSQVPPGFCRSIAWEHLYYHVETLVFGQAIQRATQPERFIVGSRDKGSLPVVLREYLAIYSCPILEMSYESAELTKISINLFLISSVSTTNLLARVASEIGACWGDIAAALRLDRRIGPHAYLSPGLGIAGGNLERDMASLIAMAHQVGVNPTLVEVWREQSKRDAQWVFTQLESRGLHKDKRIGCLGLAYKKDTASLKNSPAIALLSQLERCECRAYDPVVHTIPLPYVEIVASPQAACTHVDAIVIMTPWDQFSYLSTDVLGTHLYKPLIIDPYGVLPSKVREEYEYLRLGEKVHHEETVSASTASR